MHVASGMKCNNPNCQLSSHKSNVKKLYQQICVVLDNASKHCVASSKIDYYQEHIVSCFTEHVKELYDIVYHDFVTQRSDGEPRFGEGWGWGWGWINTYRQ